MVMRERAKKSPFYVDTQIGNLRIGNLRMRRKKLCKPSYAYAYVTEPKKSQPKAGRTMPIHTVHIAL